MIESTRFEDVLQIKMSREHEGNPVYWVAAYLVDGLLIDSGCHYTSTELTSLLQDHPPTLGVNTHFHEDHVGANKDVMEKFGIDFFAHPESIELMAKKASLYPYQEFVWGYPEPSEALPVPNQIRTTKYVFDVLETPGHSAGHVALVEKNMGWCFSGDIFARAQPKFIRPEEDMARTLDSIKKLSGVESDRLVLFTSVGKIIEDGKAALNEYAAYLEDLAQKARDLELTGLEASGIVRELFGGEHSFSEMTNGQYTTENLIRSVLKIKREQP